MKKVIFGLLLVTAISNIAFAQNQTITCSSDKFPYNKGSDIVFHLWKNKLTSFVTLYMHGETDPIKKDWVSYNPGKIQHMPYGKTVIYLEWAGGWPGSPRYAALYNFFYDGINPIKSVHLGVSERKYAGQTWYNNETVYTYKCN